MHLPHPVARGFQRESLDGLDQRHDRDDPVAPLGVRQPDHLSGSDLRVLTQPRGHGRRRDVDPAADHHVVDATQHVEPPVLIQPAGVRGHEPAVHAHVCGRVGVADVAVEEHRPAEPDPPVHREGDRRAVEWQTVVHTATAGLRHPVRRHQPDPGRFSTLSN
jgi:hypothetical protein